MRASRSGRPYPQVPSALTGPHSYFGQQLAGSVPTTLAQAQRIAGQMLAAPVVEARVGRRPGRCTSRSRCSGRRRSLSASGRSGRRSRLSGRRPACSDAGRRRRRRQHALADARPALAGAAGVADAVVVGEIAGAGRAGGRRHAGRRIGRRTRAGSAGHAPPLPARDVAHLAHRAVGVHLAAGLGDVRNADAVAARFRRAVAHLPAAGAVRVQQATAGRCPPTLPSAHMIVGRPSCGPHLVTSHAARAGSVVVIGGSRHADRSHFWSAPQLESSLQMPRAGLQ